MSPQFGVRERVLVRTWGVLYWTNLGLAEYVLLEQLFYIETRVRERVTARAPRSARERLGGCNSVMGTRGCRRCFSFFAQGGGGIRVAAVHGEDEGALALLLLNHRPVGGQTLGKLAHERRDHQGVPSVRRRRGWVGATHLERGKGWFGGQDAGDGEGQACVCFWSRAGWMRRRPRRVCGFGFG